MAPWKWVVRKTTFPKSSVSHTLKLCVVLRIQRVLFPSGKVFVGAQGVASQQLVETCKRIPPACYVKFLPGHRQARWRHARPATWPSESHAAASFLVSPALHNSFPGPRRRLDSSAPLPPSPSPHVTQQWEWRRCCPRMTRVYAGESACSALL